MVVEDDPGIRRYMEDAINGQADLRCVGSFDRIQPSRQALQTSPPDILLLDLGLPDGHGIELISLCKQLNPLCEILVITSFSDDANIIRCLEAGAQGYILKDAFHPDIPRFISELRQGGSPISPRIGRKLLSLLRQQKGPSQPSPATTVCPSPDESNLSGREAEVLNLIARGYSYQEISGHLAISLNTVRTYIKQIYQKLAVRSRGEAVFEAAKMGWLPAQLLRPDS
ncbi:response regulator transcription factor [Curvibacter gracilis]|uniref:response regulator transcription factor n=1 Tax=Curvibacter gracilis TaxID=230310 RepID=UPI0004BCE0BD|nr:response regulator transcription factor [Curvibacter gracilis]